MTVTVSQSQKGYRSVSGSRRNGGLVTKRREIRTIHLQFQIGDICHVFHMTIVISYSFVSTVRKLRERVPFSPPSRPAPNLPHPCPPQIRLSDFFLAI